MPDDWGFFERVSESKEHMRILVNCAWKKEAPPQELGRLLSITINLYSVRSQQKNKTRMIAELESLEQQLETAVSASGQSIYVGRINTPKKLEYYYYMSENASFEPLESALAEHREYRLHYYSKADPDWTFYRYMLPNTLEELFIHNAQMVFALLNRGDDIRQPRNVYHWLLFREPDDRTIMRMKLEGMGYRIEEGKSGEPEPEFPYPLVISRYEDVRLETVNGRVDELYRMLGGNGGKYDGWGSVMKQSAIYRLKLWIKKRLCPPGLSGRSKS
ncbi:DUF695 domain-containing protein [Paenibacillus pasadenensis]|uniref:DUF695 domain-containing protein n=1 Tax=Paenibacillus pasadenensis TaxID=217090 RepID=UPI0020410E1D|nr:DUF695 domain-containing protein [Paenibacillus pasadenensis]MCM3748165.1 DUF695 domain-containing protein [Paenibacillus pasadenensis]